MSVVELAEIAADQDGVVEFRSAIRRIQIEKEDAEERLRRNEVWAKNFDDKIKPFEATWVAFPSPLLLPRLPSG